MYRDIINQRKKDFEGAFSFAKTEVAGIRTGRANSSLVEDLAVDYLGSRLHVKELATITIPEPRVIMIQPWDKGAIPAIEKGIRESQLGLSPVTTGQAIILNLPPLTEERRKEFIRLLHQKIEEVRIRMRQIREEILKKVQSEIREKKGRDDDLRAAKDDLQKIINDLNKRLDELTKKKEQELLSS
ncbi:MAG TPA: ribosome recycling factor [Candidatus Paceibacterota bacterium]|nr:ribosome recycling factor [Candidatus Paceibacterota bacterium]